MPSLIQSAFSGGEWAPEYHGRTDLKEYAEGAAKICNFVVLPQGGATRRPGFRFVANAKTATVQLRALSPASNVRYTLEFSATTIRFYRKRAAILSGGTPYEVTTPYLSAEIGQLSFTQDLGTLYIWHANHPPQALIWGGSDTSWTLAAAPLDDGPYLDPIGSVSTLTPAGAGSATETLNAASIAEINGGIGFVAGDVGRLVRLNQTTLQLSSNSATIAASGTGYAVGDQIIWAGGTYIRPAVSTVTQIDTNGVIVAASVTDAGQYLVAPTGAIGQASSSGGGSGISWTPTWPQTQLPVWSWGTITTVNSAAQIVVALGLMTLDAVGTTIQGVFAGTAAITQWRLGAWCSFEGYPTKGVIFQDRLIAGGTAGQPKRPWGSETGDYSSFAPSLASGQVIDDNGLDFTLTDDEAGPIGWFNASGKAQIPQLGIGTGDAEFIIEPSPNGTSLTPTGIQSFKETRYTNAAVQPLHIGRALLFADRSAQRLRQWTYMWMVGGYIGPEASPFSRHLLLPQIAQLEYALTPHPVVWARMGDGSLIGMTYQLDEQPQLAAWHQHRLGGSYYGKFPLVQALAISPCEDNTPPYDEIWVAVGRNDPGGGATTTIEVSTPYFRSRPLSEAVFLDGAISSALTYPNATCTPAAGPYSPSANPLLPMRGDTVSFTFSANVAVAGDLNPGTILRIDDGTFLLTAVASATAVVTQCLDPPSSLLPQLANAWSYTALQTSFTGFDALDGRVATIYGDGIPLGTQTVSGGAIALTAPGASYITAGLPYASELDTLDLDLPAADGTSQMKTGRLDHLYLRLFETVGGVVGPDTDHLDPIDYDVNEAPSATTWPTLVSDDIRTPLPGGSSAHRQITVIQADPWPMTISALVVKGGTTEQAPR